jgi:hypothetical protein
MARSRAPSKRVLLNREALDTLTLLIADSTVALADALLTESAQRLKPHRRFGVLEESGGYLVLVRGRKVAGPGSKPRSFRRTGETISTIVGYGAPHGHLLEFGTVRQPPRPWFRPSADVIAQRAKALLAETIRQGLEAAR